MNRDLVIQNLVAVDAQLRRLERLSNSISDAVEHKARIPPLIAESRRQLQSLCGRLEQSESGNRKA
jgi:hypothetical protein